MGDPKAKVPKKERRRQKPVLTKKKNQKKLETNQSASDKKPSTIRSARQEGHP